MTRVADKVFACINAAERIICGAHAVTSPARADGLALAGQRAANLLQPAARDFVSPPPGPRVHHCVAAQPGPGQELVATSAQEAVDQCLAAHLLAERTGQPMVCRVPPELAEELAIVTLPTPDQVHALLGAGGDPLDEATALAETKRVLAREEAAPPAPDADDALAVRLGVVPQDAWGRRQLLDFVARIGCTGDLCLAEDATGLVVSRGQIPDNVPEQADLLLVCGPVDEAPDGWVEQVRPRGIVVQVTSGDLAQGGWHRLPPETLEQLRERSPAFWHFDAGFTPDGWADILVAAGGECIKRLRLPVPDVPLADPPRRVSLDEVQAVPAPAASTGPTMSPPGAEPSEDLAPEIRQFHLAGEGGPFAVEPLPAHPLHPAALTGWAKPSDRDWPFPLVLPHTVPLHSLLTRAVDNVEIPDTERKILRGELWRICRHAMGRIEQDAEVPSMRDLVRESAQAVVQAFEAGPEGRDLLKAAVEKVAKALPAGGRLAGPTPATLMDLYAERVQRRRRPALQRLCRDAHDIVVALEARLEADRLHRGEGQAPSHLQATVGAVGTSLVDVNALSKSLPAHRGSRNLSPEEQERLEGIVAELKRFLEAADASPDFRRVDSFALAVGLFDGVAAGYLPVFRAIRAGRLEVEGNYDPASHAEPLARLHVAVLTEDELEAMPRVVVVAAEHAVQQASLETFSQVLQSGRPIHALILRRLTDGDEDAETGMDSFYPGLGYVSIAHREAYVFQGLLADPAELVAGLDGMMNTQRPSVAFIASPGSGGSAEWHWLRAETARQGRAAPQFSYDPEKGVHWAHRFDLSHNPQPEQAWPALPVAYTDEDGAPQTMTERFTFAHAAALEPAYRRHFRILPREAWSEDQWPVADYLDALEDKPPEAIPYLWVVGSDGQMKRAVVTRELVLRCRDRMRFWTLLQELAGINNEHVRAAVGQARAEAAAEVEAIRAELAQAHARELEEARNQESAATIDRLVSVLMQHELPPPPPKPAPPPAEEPTPEPEPDPPPEPAADEDISLEDPYIETFRCTTCDECTQLNPRMFVYNEDKQAILADLDAGTFADLVIAAEKCPANCIFPGIPRNGDPTATPEMLERARAL